MRSPDQNIAIRVDASSQIGTGHYTRCLTLGDALKARGARVRFLSRHVPPHLREIVAGRGHELAILESAQGDWTADGLLHSPWLGTAQAADAADTLGALADRNWSWLIVDHYALDARWERSLRRSVDRVCVIDDIADRPHDCDVLLDQNLHDGMDARYEGKVSGGCRLLLGPRYAMLRGEFRYLRATARPRQGRLERVFVFISGVDAENYTARAIEALAGIEDRELRVDVVIGDQHPDRRQVEDACRRHHYECHVQTDRMAELMAAADLAVGAGGSASWERCCLGLPALLVTVAENQVSIATALDRFGAAVYLGPIRNATPAVLRSSVVGLLKDEPRLRALSETAFSLVDGQGVDRVCEALS